MSKKDDVNLFSALKSFLLKTARGIEQIAEGIDDIGGVLDETFIDMVGKGKAALDKSQKSVGALKAKAKSKKNTATALVQGIIEDAKDTVSVTNIMEMTEFSKKQVYNILAKLKARGAIVGVSRGMYKATDTAPVKETAKKTAKAKAAKKRVAKKSVAKKRAAKNKLQNTERVLDKIKAAGELSVKELEVAMPDLTKKALQNTIFKLKKAALITSPRRGVYKAQ